MQRCSFHFVSFQRNDSDSQPGMSAVQIPVLIIGINVLSFFFLRCSCPFPLRSPSFPFFSFLRIRPVRLPRHPRLAAASDVVTLRKLTVFLVLSSPLNLDNID